MATVHRSMNNHKPTVWTCGFDVAVEALDGLQVLALPRPTGGARMPSLGVESYVYTVAQRLSGERDRGPFGAPRREVTPAEVNALRAALREHLRAIDRGEVAT